MPTAPNTHESAQAIRPDARVVYVDSDPVAVSRLREVAVKGSPGLTAVDGDVGVTALFDGTELVSPGVVDARQWHPGWSDLPALPFRTGQATCGVGRIG